MSDHLTNSLTPNQLTKKLHELAKLVKNKGELGWVSLEFANEFLELYEYLPDEFRENNLK